MRSRPYLKQINFAKRILEIGPLTHPNIPKSNMGGGGYTNVFYADIRSTKEIKAFYKNDPNVNIDEVADIDYVVRNTYRETFCDVEKFDYIVATHVLEHIPQLIAWFQDIASIMKPGGRLCLSIPDKRYIFDHYRYPTTFAECYDIYYRKVNNLPVRVFDHILTVSHNNTLQWWEKTDDYDCLPKDNQIFERAIKTYLRSLKGDYIDVHFSVFTPESFLMLLYYLICFRLFPFRVKAFYPTFYPENEFSAVFEINNELLNKNSPEAESEKNNIVNLLKKFTKIL